MMQVPLQNLRLDDVICLFEGPRAGINYSGSDPAYCWIDLVGTGTIRIETNSDAITVSGTDAPAPGRWSLLAKIPIPGRTKQILPVSSSFNWIRILVEQPGSGTCTVTPEWAPVDAVTDPLVYQGMWNATANTPAIASGIGFRGGYYIVEVPGNTSIDDLADWKFGDWIVFNGTKWLKRSLQAETGPTNLVEWSLGGQTWQASMISGGAWYLRDATHTTTSLSVDPTTSAAHLAGNLTILGSTAIPAGGTTGAGYKFSSTSNLGLFFGSGVPSLNAAQGSLYLRSDGAPYYNNNGTTGWSSLAGGSGTVTTASVITANGFAGSVANATTTPAITLTTTITGILQGNGTAISAASTTGSGNVVLATSPTLVTPALGIPTALTLTNATGLPIGGLTGLGSGVAAFLTTPSSANLATAITDETGSGALVFANTPTLVTPVLGVASATTINKVAITAPASGSTLTIVDGKTLTASNTVTLSGTDGSTVAFGAGGTIAYTGNNLSVFAATTSAQLAGVISDETGSGALVFATSPTLVSPALGTPTALTLTNATGLPIGGITGLGTGIASFLGTPSSANLATAITDETGSGALVFATSPTLVTPVLGVASATTINKVTITAPATGSTLTIVDGKTLTAGNTLSFAGTDGSSVAFGTGGTVAYQGGTLAQFAATTSAQLAGVISDETGSGALVFATSPALVTPNLGIPTALTLTNATGLPIGGITGLGTGIASFLGTPSSANLATAITDETGSGALVFANTPTLVTPVLGAATGTSLSMTGALTSFSGTSIPAGGTTGTGNKFSSTSNFGVFFGSGAPTLSAAQGSLYLRSDGLPHYNTNGTTGWTSLGLGTVTTASVVSANGFAGSVANATTTPAITLTTSITGLLQGNGTAISAASTTGSGNVVLDTTPTLVTPVLGAATGTSLSLTGALTSYSGTSIPAGGTTGSGIKVSSTSNFGMFFGSGAPTLSAAQGSMYLRSDGAPYYNTNGTTGWTSLLPGTPNLDTISSTQGDILYRGASSWSGLATGTAGQVLVAGGAAANPSWSTAGRPLLDTLTASSSPSLPFTATNSTLFAGYECEFENVVPATDNTQLVFQFSVNGGSTYLNSGYVWQFTYALLSGGGAAAGAGSTSDSAINMGGGNSNNAAHAGYGGFAKVSVGGAATNATKVIFQLFYIQSGGTSLVSVSGGGSNAGTSSQINAFRFIMLSGNIASGVIRVYGIPK